MCQPQSKNLLASAVVWWSREGEYPKYKRTVRGMPALPWKTWVVLYRPVYTASREPAHIEHIDLISMLAPLPAAVRCFGNPAQLSADRREGNQPAPVLLQYEHCDQAQLLLTSESQSPPHQVLYPKRGIQQPECSKTDPGCAANVPGLPSPKLIRQLWKRTLLSSSMNYDVSHILCKTPCKCSSQGTELVWNNQLLSLWFRHFWFKTILVALRRSHKISPKDILPLGFTSSDPTKHPGCFPRHCCCNQLHTPRAVLNCCVLREDRESTRDTEEGDDPLAASRVYLTGFWKLMPNLNKCF